MVIILMDKNKSPYLKSEVHDAYGFLGRLKTPALWLVILMYILVMIFYFLNINIKFNPTNLTFILNIIFVFIPSLIIALIAARSFFSTGNWAVLGLGIGTLSFGLAAFLSFFIALFAPINASSTNFPIIMFISGLSFFFAAIFLITNTPPQENGRARIITLLLTYIGIIALVIIITVISIQNILPPFFIQGIGSTALRQLILIADTSLFFISGLIIYNQYMKSKSLFLFWYALGLFLIFLVLISNLLLVAVGTPLNWILRITQLLGGVYLFIAALVILKEATIHQISPGEALAQFFHTRKSELNILLSSVHDAIILYDYNFIITGWNKGAEKIYKWNAEEAIGNTITILKTTYPDVDSKDVTNQIIEQNSWIGEAQQTAKDGKLVSVWGSTSTIKDNSGKLIGFMTINHDFSERKNSEQALKDASDNLKSVVQELKRSNQDLERFAYVSSHDLQEPLRMVTLYSQLLEKRYKDKFDDDADDFIDYILEGAQRMRELINDLLEYSRVKDQATKFEKVDMKKVLDVVIHNLKMPIKEHNVNISYDYLPTVMGDQKQMLQVFQNLITNAIKFRRKNPPEIHISANKEEKMWKFAISDNGIGIDERHQDQIFEVFKRLHTKEKYPGTGIGLSIVKKIITHHNRKISIESQI